MALIKELLGKTPVLGDDCFVAETAVLVGDVTLGNQCSIWYNAVIRGDVNSITIGNQVNIQDNVTIHATYQKASTHIGNFVSIGHNAIVHGCTLHDRVLVGMGAIVMDQCVVDSYAIVAAGAVVTQNTHIKEGELWAGVPAKKIGMVSQNLRDGEIERIAHNYVTYSSWYKEQ